MNKLVKRMKLLGSPYRFHILESIYNSIGWVSTPEIMEKTKMAQDLTSQYLKQLVDAGVIEKRTDNGRNWYILTDDMRQFMDKVLEGEVYGK